MQPCMDNFRSAGLNLALDGNLEANSNGADMMIEVCSRYQNCCADSGIHKITFAAVAECLITSHAQRSCSCQHVADEGHLCMGSVLP